MRHMVICLIVLLLSATYTLAQNTTPATAKASEATIAQAEKPKNEVEKILAEANHRGEPIRSTCLEKCGDQAKAPEGLVVGQAQELPAPVYPVIARQAGASGEVQVQIVIDVDGNVIAAAAIAGHPLLQSASVDAARKTHFAPSTYEGNPVKVTGVITYSFVRQ
jgi:TonB family protein